jgi:hypothetical protein
MDLQHLAHFSHQFLDAKRFGDVRQAIAFQKFPRLRGNDVSSDK